MGYTLTPRNKKVEAISVGAFTWPIILQETGMGYVIGYGAGREPASYVYQNNNIGSPVSNDGYRVGAFDAKCMANVAHGFLCVQRFVNKAWDKYKEENGEEEYNRSKEMTSYKGQPIYRQPWSEEQLNKIEKIADFIKASGGFTIS